MEAILTRFEGFSVVASDPTHVAAARSGVQRLSRSLAFDEVRAGRAAIVATEAVSNMLKHAGGGTLVVRSVQRAGALGIEMVAIDSGPGMADVDASARDGVSSSGTPGTGLGAMRRLSDEMDIYSRPARGTILRTLSWNGESPPQEARYEVGVVCVPKPGETANGDAWDMVVDERGATMMVADGLGHGPEASRASATAVEALHRHAGGTPVRILDAAHGRMRATRGAAVAVMRHDAQAGELVFAGVGNIAAVVIQGGVRRATVSHSGIVGHNVHKSVEYRYPWTRGGLLVAHSDGLESQWDLGAFPGLDACHPAVIAAMLYREHSRRRDDCTVLVVRAMA